jgi:ubiquinone/menaquinone biosynthesis C-methylase UbiE
MVDLKEDYQKRLRGQIELHKDLRDVYDKKRYARDYSLVYQKYWNRALLGLAPPGEDGFALDLGCGTGILIPDLLRRGARPIGLDLSLDMLGSAREQNRDVRFVCGDGSALPFAREALRLVVCRGSIHHFPDLEAAFKEIHRVLEKGGYLVFSEPSNDSPINRWARRAMYRKNPEFDESDEGFRREEILPLLERSGFAVEKSRGFGFFAYTLAGFPDKFDLLSRLPCSRLIARGLIQLDRFLQVLPFFARFALHWQVRARKT